MSFIFEGFKPLLLWKHFEQIMKIPHCSGNETGLGDYIISEAKRLDLVWKRDKVGNVIVAKKASPGHENAETIIFQGHMDMVGEKNSDVAHDFAKDAIQAEVQGEWVQAKGTTLGSDNGIGVAASLAIMEENSLKHGPLEFLFTVDEETGLTGATKIGPGFLTGKKLLNLDSEDEGAFTIGCAGGADSEITYQLKRQTSKGGELYRLKVFGFRGGHSGIDIDQGRGNAIKLLTRLLWQTKKEFPFELVIIEGGNKRNAIAREAWADVLLDPAQSQEFSSSLQKAFEKIIIEYKTIEKDANFSFEKSEEEKEDPLTDESQKVLINLLFTLPHGVIAKHPEMKDLVETSTNMAIVKTFQDHAQIICSSRSSVASALEATRNSIEAICELAGADIVQPDGYPGWAPNLQSSLLKIFKELYQRTFQKEPEVAAVHAGLECGIIGEKFPGMDMISFGPTIEHPHSPEERVHIGSVEKFWTFLTAVLAELA
ncbi:MAG: aminoacyl-histidine dipeptidase [Candidatus Aminicenantes bacterium]|nr:aminoacyl-histidine dipeptidase [Candidatus Aminicenantes bacterium]MBL7082296.1 aminoacyl-histidine dipeptidase [Candidatus Aminicenantes bacterium]